MASFVFVFAALCLSVSAAPPAPPRLYQQQAPEQLQQTNPLDFYIDHSELQRDLSRLLQRQKQDNESANANQSSGLETLEPDSEVELLPGAQAPQQPPQQPPVGPNLPGLVPGQRVFIVHMPIPGYRPGTIGGYQPVYIVAAAPPANPGFPGNGYQNAVFLDPSRQGVAPLGYPQGVLQGGNPALVQGVDPYILGGHQFQNRPFNLIYQDQGVYQQPGPIKFQAGPEGNQGFPRLQQMFNLQKESAGLVGHNARPQATGTEASSAEPKQLNQAIIESKESRNARPTSAHVQSRTKA